MKYSPRRSAEQWQLLVDEQRVSGLSAQQFCKEHDVGYASFTIWRKRLIASDSATSAIQPAFVELTSPDPVEPPSSWSVELTLGTGICVRITKA